MSKDAFKSDGCSMWPDGKNTSCCELHDKDYYEGGSSQARLLSDIELMLCVADNTSTFMARLMFIGVSLGGVPWLPLPWRWAFGKRFKDSWRYSP